MAALCQSTGPRRDEISDLEQCGFSVRTDCLFDASYLDALYAVRREPGAILRAYRNRLASLDTARRADLIWLETEALPSVPAGLERRLFPAHVPVVSDFDDAVLHRYDSHSNPVVRVLLGRKIARVMARSDLVLAGNDDLGTYAAAAGARGGEVVPTVVDTTAYDAARRLLPRPHAWAGSARRARGAPVSRHVSPTSSTRSARCSPEVSQSVQGRKRTMIRP